MAWRRAPLLVRGCIRRAFRLEARWNVAELARFDVPDSKAAAAARRVTAGLDQLRIALIETARDRSRRKVKHVERHSARLQGKRVLRDRPGDLIRNVEHAPVVADVDAAGILERPGDEYRFKVRIRRRVRYFGESIPRHTALYAVVVEPNVALS